MDTQWLWAILAGLAIMVGAVGIIIPVLPGSALIAVSLLVWAVVVNSPVGWIFFAVAMLFVAIGMTSSLMLTGRAMRRERIPHASVLVGALVGVVGFFVVPIVGLALGFAVGLYGSELVRQKALRPALNSSVAALKAIGIGILVEFSCASVAGGIWIIGVLVYFAHR